MVPGSASRVRFAAAGLFAIASLAFATAPDSAITGFDRPFSASFYIDYGSLNFSPRESDDLSFTSNRPVKIGLGFGYRDYSLYFFTMQLPFTSDGKRPISDGYESSLNAYYDRIAFLASVRSFRGFSVSIDGEERKSDLELFEGGLTVLYVINFRQISLRAAYALDRRQHRSGGSLVIGGDAYFYSIYSGDSAETEMAFYSQRRHIVSLGPNIGYTYTFAFKSGFFVNALAMIGTNVGTSGTGSGWDGKQQLLSLRIVPKIAFGQAFEKWAYNMTVQSRSSVFFFHYDKVDYLIDGQAGVSLVRRF